MARAPKNTAPVAEVAAPVVAEVATSLPPVGTRGPRVEALWASWASADPQLCYRALTAAERVELARAELADVEEEANGIATKAEEERVAALKFSFESLNATFDAAEAELEAFEAGLSVADRALLGIKVQADRTPKGAALVALRAHVETMAPGAVFELKDLPETATLGATPGTVYKALRALGVQVTGKGKGSKYHVPSNQEIVNDHATEVPAEVPAAGEPSASAADGTSSSAEVAGS